MHERGAKSFHTNDATKKHQTADLEQNPSFYLPDNSSNDFTIFRKASCSCGGGCPACQAKSSNLNISQPNDPAEIEADQIADRVLRMSDNEALGVTKIETRARNDFYRKLDQGEEAKESVLRKPLQRRGGDSAQKPDHVNAAVSSGGKRLDTQTRNFFEPRFGYDLSNVRIHANATASRSASALDAKAYTLCKDIVFGRGEYEPRSVSGKLLLAHELAHVIQESDPLSAEKSGTLFRYRTKGKETIAFDEPNETLKDPKKQPWIESIKIHFDTAAVDTGHKADAQAAGQIEPRMPLGNLTAKYSTKSTDVPSDISLKIAGGSTMLGIGLTDRVKDEKVIRLEGLGYTDSQNISLGNLTDPVSKTGKGARYSKSGAGTMNYAIFFKGIQAIHQGDLNIGSHACVHVDKQNSIKTLNYHTRIGITTVTVTYDQSVLDDLCCHRKRTGNTNWNTNPCEKTNCP